MKLVYVMPFMRVPPDFGLAIRDYHLLNYLAEHHSVVLLAFETPEQGRFAEWARERMSEFVSLGMYPAPREPPNRFPLWSRLVEWVPSSLARVQPRALARKIQTLVENQSDIDLIIFDTHLTAQATLYLRGLVIPMVAVLPDVYTNHARRQFTKTSWRPYKLVYGLDLLRMYVYENRILARYRYLVTMSETDAAWVRRHAPQARVFVSPNGVDTSYFLPNSKPHIGKNLIFVGNFAYGPNEDGFFFLVEEILPRVHAECPEALLTVVGLYPTDTMYHAAQRDSRIQLTGQVPDVRPNYAQADVAVVPLRVGSGIKLKVLEAMSMGVPLVTTRVGCEGIDAKSGEHLLIADHPEDFAQCILRLLKSGSEASRIAARARSYVEKYDWNMVANDFERTLTYIVTNYPQ